MAVDIKDRIATGDDLYIIEQLVDGRVRITPAPDSVQEQGTPINKALLQPIFDYVANTDTPLPMKTSGEWKYQEWANGKIEYWGGFTIPSGISIAQATETGFYTSAAIDFLLPVKSKNRVWAVASSASQGLLATVAFYDLDSVSIRLAANKSMTTTGATYVNIYVVGNTK